jgi:hypothetical protein
MTFCLPRSMSAEMVVFGDRIGMIPKFVTVASLPHVLLAPIAKEWWMASTFGWAFAITISLPV